MPNPPGRTWLARAWFAVPVVAALAAAMSVLLPACGAGLCLRLVVKLVLGLSATGALLVLRSRGTPGDARGWLLLVAGQLVYAGTAAVLLGLSQVDSVIVSATTRDVLVAAHYPLTAAGLVALLRARGALRDRVALLDTALLLAGGVLLAWTCLVGPVLRAHGVSGAGLVPALCTGVGLVVAAAAILLLASDREPSPAVSALAGGLLAALLADTVGMYAHRADDPGRHLPAAAGLLAGRDLGWSVSALLLIIAALHPVRGGLAVPGGHRGAPSAPPVRAGRGLVLVCAVGLVGPVTLGIEAARGGGPDTLVIAVAVAAIVLLIIARMAQMEADQRRLAITDGLTGLHTRRYLEAEMRVAARRARDSGTAMGLLLVDVDHFKSVNDRFGHPAGDRVLTEVARRLLAVTRPGDVVARYGGEEFALLAMDVRAEALADIAERLRLGIAREPMRIPPPSGDRDAAPPRPVPVTVSVGGALLPDHAADVFALVAVADRALYAAKDAGRNRIAIGSVAVGPTTARAPAAPGPAPTRTRVPARLPASTQMPASARTRAPEPHLPRVPRPGGIAMVLPESAAVEAATYAVTAALTPLLRGAPRRSLDAVESLCQVAAQVDEWHTPRVDGSAVACWLGEVLTALGYAAGPQRRARRAARLHNVGKILLPPEALGRLGPLDAEEWRLIRMHPVMGASLLARLPDLRAEAEIVAQQREWFAGGGYPTGVSGPRIRTEARVLAVCTAWAAMRGGRGERGPMSAAAAREQLWAARATQFDPDVVDVFLALEAQRRVGRSQPDDPPTPAPARWHRRSGVDGPIRSGAGASP
ncbi:bifunctional diguanylate cyclase/phosphohydrolase [Frankia canadensis]|nr:diguanylate cyclase [Frankia canadensis]